MKRKYKSSTHLAEMMLIAVYASASLALVLAAPARPFGRDLSPHLNEAEQAGLRLQIRGVDKPLAILAGTVDAAFDGFGNGGKIVQLKSNEYSAFRPYSRPAVTLPTIKASTRSAFRPYGQVLPSNFELRSNDRPLFDLNEPASDLDDVSALPVASVSRTEAEADDAVHLKGSKFDSEATSQSHQSTTLTASSDPQLSPGRTTEELEVPRTSTSAVSPTNRPDLGGPRGYGANRVSWAAGRQPTTLHERVLQQIAWQRMQGRVARGRKTLQWTLVKSPEWSDAQVEAAVRGHSNTMLQASKARTKEREATAAAAAARLKEKEEWWSKMKLR